MDQGERLFRFWFNAGKAKERLLTIDREALLHNEKPTAISFFPSGNGKKPNQFAVVSDKSVQITAIKQAHTSDDYIIRVYEPTGEPKITELALPMLGFKRKINLGGFEVKTLKISRHGRNWKNVDLIEKKLKST